MPFRAESLLAAGLRPGFVGVGAPRCPARERVHVEVWCAGSAAVIRRSPRMAGCWPSCSARPIWRPTRVATVCGCSTWRNLRRSHSASPPQLPGSPRRAGRPTAARSTSCRRAREARRCGAWSCPPTRRTRSPATRWRSTRSRYPRAGIAWRCRWRSSRTATRSPAPSNGSRSLPRRRPPAAPTIGCSCATGTSGVMARGRTCSAPKSALPVRVPR